MDSPPGRPKAIHSTSRLLFKACLSKVPDEILLGCKMTSGVPASTLLDSKVSSEVPDGALLGVEVLSGVPDEALLGVEASSGTFLFLLAFLLFQVSDAKIQGV